MLDVSNIELYLLLKDTPKTQSTKPGMPYDGFRIQFERVSAYELFFVEHEETVVWIGLGILVGLLFVIGYKIY